mmetsp:Transcript_105985/g.147763  ORF Transcript_105985/g.147763 Transcript_105985/m.147763 type:complete len:115 (-) Transcript_105985:106-450(-)
MFDASEAASAEAKRWKSIYPAYLDKNKTVKEGRRVPKEKGVERPTVQEIGEICQYYELKFHIEVRKAYPKDWINPGRVKILFKDEDGKVFNDTVPSKKEFLLKAGELIPKLKSR